MTAVGPRVLVTAASRHGATAGIAEFIARELPETPAGRAAGLTAIAQRVEHQPNPAPFTAVLLGSAVYAGRWLEPARTYATSHVAVLRGRPLWLFSSGPIGEPPFPPAEPHDVGPLVALTAALGHQVFAGRLDPALLTVGERAMVTAMRAPLGDFRDWDAVRAWTEQVAVGIVERSLPTAVPR